MFAFIVGELTNIQFQSWINLQCAGVRNCYHFYSVDKGKEVYYPEREAIDKIKNWYKNKLFLYDNENTCVNTELTKILKVFEYAYKKKDCKIL